MKFPENVSKGQKVNSDEEGAKDRAPGNTTGEEQDLRFLSWTNCV